MKELKGVLNTAVIVSALGYFVDIYDLILFGVVKDPSLAALGYEGDLDKGVLLLNMQMAGMLIGGIIWGIWGDKKGRISVLFGSIFLYSAANIANGFVNDITTYAILRFIAGVGLAGELGAGITLVSETLPTNKRGYGTMIVVVFGALGAVLAALVGDLFEWRIAYFVGGGLGLLLLLMRVGTFESGMYKKVETSSVRRGDFLMLFTDRKRFLRYLNCILIGLPVWYVVGILIIFSRDFSKAIGVDGPIVGGTAIMFTYIGLSAGDLISGLLSQLLKSRKKTVLIFLGLNIILVMVYLFSKNISATYFYFLCFALGTATGYWAIFVTIAAEQFGTNLRSTVTTTVPNFVRGSVLLLTTSFVALQNFFGIVPSALIVGIASISLALIAVLSVQETFHKNLDYIEEIS